MQIKELFDSSKDIYRTIEKVITYSAAQETRLSAEISEYIVTDHIEEQFAVLLENIQLALEQGGQNEVGVWVSGFYGSGKSSFTKYLGMALDDSITIDEVPFRTHLQNRMNKPQVPALLNTLSARFPAAVVLLDLASDMLAGASMEDVSSVLYYKVLQWAGYSQNLKVAAFERRLEQDDRYDEFIQRIETDLGMEWRALQNDELVVESLLPEIAHEMYPALFKTTTSFNTDTSAIVRFETNQVQDMIDIVRQKSDRDFIIFIIDEVGQYVGSRDNLILNLDGLAKNLKSIGDGKVWIVGTAQQTLTEDDPKAALNSPELFKLAARFPIQIDLESNDIKEICTGRLLGKSARGEETLGQLFDSHGQALRHNTKLQDAKFYDSDFGRKTFIDLYPFLPAHFDILLHLLGALAKSTGGIGLRSAIKVIQDILVERNKEAAAVADREVGWLATTVTLYDALEKDIRRAFPSIYGAVGKTIMRFPDSDMHPAVAKTVAVLQILGNMPVTSQNVGSLLHPAIDAASQRDAIAQAIAEMIGDSLAPFGENEGNLCFFSEKVNEIDQERAQLNVRGMESRRIRNDTLRTLFSPLPSTRIHNVRTVSAGLKIASSSQVTSLAGDRETIQFVAEFADPTDYATVRSDLVDESRQRSSQYTIFMLGRGTPEIDAKAAEIYRCTEIVRRYRNDPDQEVKEYCTAQTDRVNNTLTGELTRLLRQSLGQGSFIFRGQATAAESLSTDVAQAAKSYLSTVADQVFERYGEAPVRADTALAERFLKAGNLSAVTSTIDPLGLAQMDGNTPSIDSNHKALVSIRDYIERHGVVEGSQLSSYFQNAPFGWSPDTLRYLVAAMLMGGEIKLKASGQEVTVNGQLAIDALRTNNAFKPVGVALRDERPSNELLARAAERLTDLTGDMVIPLEDEISKAALKYISNCQYRFGPLAEKLNVLALPGANVVTNLTQELASITQNDASDAPQRLGNEESLLYEHLTWAAAVQTALNNGLEGTIQALRHHCNTIHGLPDTGIPGQLRREVADEMALVEERLGQECFYEHAADLRTTLTAIQARTRDAASQFADTQRQTLQNAQVELTKMYDWDALSVDEQQQTLGQLDQLVVDATADLDGIRKLLNQEFVIQSQINAIKQNVIGLAKDRHRLRTQETAKERTPFEQTIAMPAVINSPAQLDELIQRLQSLKQEIAYRSTVELTIELT